MNRRSLLKAIGIGSTAVIVPGCAASIPAVPYSTPTIMLDSFDVPADLDTLTEIANALAIDGEFQKVVTTLLTS
ncbi:hypothetical protein D9M68_18990 [compost metagenome]